MNQAWLLCLFVVTLAIYLWQQRYGRSSRGSPCMYPLIGIFLEFFKNLDRVVDWSADYLVSSPSHTATFIRPGYKPFIFTANATNVEHILKTKFENYPKGDHLEDVFRDMLGDGIFNADGESWKLQRKIASFEFTTRSLREYLMQSLHQEISTRLIPTLDHFCSYGKEPVDLQDILYRFSFDNICKISFGVDPSSLHPTLPTVQFFEAFDTATSLITSRYYEFHPMVWKVKRLLNFGSERRLRDALQAVNEFADHVIAERRKLLNEMKEQEDVQGKDHDLLSRFMSIGSDTLSEEEKERASYSWDVNKFLSSDKFVKDMVISFLLAGKDTAAVAMTWFFWLLTCHPNVENNICREIEHIIAKRDKNARRPLVAEGSVNQGRWLVTTTEDHRSENEEDRAAKFSYEELKEMHYLHAAISESMRLYSPVPVDTKEAKKADVLPDGTHVEEGSTVSYHVLAMGRLESLWGKDCLEFRPERWLQDGQFMAETAFKYPVFQAGPRICLGKDMAMIQMKYIAAAVVPNFKFILDKDHRPKYGLQITLKMINGLPVFVEQKGKYLQVKE